MKNSLRVAAANWELRSLQNKSEFFNHVDEVLSEAQASAVELLVLPEYFAIELASMQASLGQKLPIDDRQYPHLLAPYFSEIQAFLETRSRELNLSIVGGSFFRSDSGVIHNSGMLFPRGAKPLIQDKQHLIPYERNTWKLAAGDGLERPVLEERAAVLICYEIEFPELSKELASSGVGLICVPSHTDTVRGFNRVRWCCHARTVEYQVFVAHAAIVGTLPGYNHNGFGSAAILCPCDGLISDTGILAETELNKAGLAIADLDFELLETVRTSGEVLNWRDQQI